MREGGGREGGRRVGEGEGGRREGEGERGRREGDVAAQGITRSDPPSLSVSPRSTNQWRSVSENSRC
jgi:hypothetical protein